MLSVAWSLVRRAPFTFALILVLLAVYAVEIAQSSPSFWFLGQGELPDIAVWGVVWTPAIADGEVWRFVTAGFLHAGLLHLALNVYVLSIIGVAAEVRLGWWRTALVFLAAVVGGNFAAAYFQPEAASLGASGGVMGLAGAVAVVVYRSGEGFARSQWVISAIVITLAFGFVNPGISNAAHIGGLLVGALAAVPMGVRRGLGPGLARGGSQSASGGAPRGAPRAQPPAQRRAFGRPSQPQVGQRELEFQRRIDEAVRKAAEERARERLQPPPPARGEGGE